MAEIAGLTYTAQQGGTAKHLIMSNSTEAVYTPNARRDDT